MATLPDTVSTPVVRADFSDDAAWAEIREVVSAETEEGFFASVEFVEDRTLAGLDEPALARAFPRAYPHGYEHPVVFVVDAATVSSPEHPILVIGLNSGDDDEPFRVVAEELHAIENNLSLANMDFFEFAAQARRGDGISRGF